MFNNKIYQDSEHYLGYAMQKKTNAQTAKFVPPKPTSDKLNPQVKDFVPTITINRNNDLRKVSHTENPNSYLQKCNFSQDVKNHPANHVNNHSSHMPKCPSNYYQRFQALGINHSRPLPTISTSTKYFAPLPSDSIRHAYLTKENYYLSRRPVQLQPQKAQINIYANNVNFYPPRKQIQHTQTLPALENWPKLKNVSQGCETIHRYLSNQANFSSQALKIISELLLHDRYGNKWNENNKIDINANISYQFTPYIHPKYGNHLQEIWPIDKLHLSDQNFYKYIFQKYDNFTQAHYQKSKKLIIYNYLKHHSNLSKLEKKNWSMRWKHQKFREFEPFLDEIVHFFRNPKIYHKLREKFDKKEITFFENEEAFVQKLQTILREIELSELLNEEISWENAYGAQRKIWIDFEYALQEQIKKQTHLEKIAEAQTWQRLEAEINSLSIM